MLVYDPAVTETEVTENRNMVALTVNPASAQDDRAAIGTAAAHVFAAELVDGVDHLGLRAVRASRGAPLPDNAVLVTGEFVDVDEGSQVKRLVVGFGDGASRVDTRMHVYYAQHGQLTRLLEFDTHSDSGKLPGGAVTLGAGVVVAGGVTVVGAIGTVAVGGVKTYPLGTSGTVSGQERGASHRVPLRILQQARLDLGRPRHEGDAVAQDLREASTRLPREAFVRAGDSVLPSISARLTLSKG